MLYTGWSNAYSEIGPEVRCDLSRHLARKITKRIHSNKPVSLNRPVYKEATEAIIFINNKLNNNNNNNNKTQRHQNP